MVNLSFYGLLSSGMLSVNQMNAECKIKEIWKALNTKDYPLIVEKQQPTENQRVTRAITMERLVEHGKTLITQKTCINDATRLWNDLPSEIKECNSIYQIKRHAKMYAKSLPI